MQERYFNPDVGGSQPRYQPKTVFQYIQLTAAERSFLKKQNAAMEAEFKEKHELKVKAYGGVFAAGAARGYPKPVMSGEHMPKCASLHPKNTPRNKDGSAKLVEFSTGLYPARCFRHVVSDRIKTLIEELEPNNYLFFPFELNDPVTGDVIKYWFFYALDDEDGIDYATSGYERSEKTGNWVPNKPTSMENTVLSRAKLEGRHFVSSPRLTFIFSKTFLDRAGDFLSPREKLVEFRIV